MIVKTHTHARARQDRLRGALFLFLTRVFLKIFYIRVKNKYIDYLTEIFWLHYDCSYDFIVLNCEMENQIFSLSINKYPRASHTDAGQT